MFQKSSQGVTYLYASRFGLASAEFDAIERGSKGPAERVLAAFNLGVAEATAGELWRAEAAFTRALGGLATGNPHAELKVETTNSSCIRGDTRFPFRRLLSQLLQIKRLQIQGCMSVSGTNNCSTNDTLASGVGFPDSLSKQSVPGIIQEICLFLTYPTF